MNATLARRHSTHRRLAALAAIGVCALAAGAGPAAADPARAHAGATITLHFYSVVQSLVHTTAAGTVVPMSQGIAAGDRLEITELGYTGTFKKHARQWSTTSHTICVFPSAKGEPACDGQGTVGGNQMVLFHTAPGGGTTVSGGTGRYAGATGSVTSKDAGNDNSDITVVVHLAK